MKNRVFSFAVSLADLEKYYIEKYGLPEDSIITHMARPANQRAFVIEMYSQKFPLSKDLDTYQTARLPEGFKWSKDA